MKFMKSLNTPVALIAFNRPDFTALVFEEIRKVRPSTLLLVADGARPNREGESEKCAATRKILESVDWPCNVHRRFLEQNLGCGLGPSRGISWVFSKVDRAIILEDDCLPNPTYFHFAGELLDKYENDSEVMHIAGSSYIPRALCPKSTYYFSRYAFTWGWATWARAWSKYDFNLAGIENEMSKLLRPLKLKGIRQKTFYSSHLTRLRAGATDFWDIQWGLVCLRNNGLCITPRNNLISNIGFGFDSTHTGQSNSTLGNRATHDIEAIVHPQSNTINEKADIYSMSYLLPPEKKSLRSIAKGALRRIRNMAYRT